MIGSAMAHSWYDRDCCSGEDCAPIPVEDVQITSKGYQIPDGTIFEYGSPKVRPSQDGEFHLCTGIHSKIHYCIYVPLSG